MNLQQIQQQAAEEFDKEFPCNHHPAQCNGDCKDREKDFLSRKIQEAFEAGRMSFVIEKADEQVGQAIRRLGER